MYSPGLRSEVGYEMAQLGGKRAVIFTDKGLVAAGIVEMVAEEVRKSDLELAGVFDSIIQDARIDIINAGAAFYRKCGADCMIAVGGGSVMDTAKAVNIMISGGNDDFQPLADQAGLWEGAKQLPPHIAFPTTAGTGCEVTNAMVVLDVAAHAKLQVTHPYCNCDIAMLDPELTIKLPAKITAFTGIDALTHAIEGITSTGAEPIADALGLHAIRLIFKYLPIAVKNPEDITARGHMLLASSIAGMCFVNTMTGGVHATAHALGALYGIPHGLANAIMLPVVMAFNASEVPERYMMIADAMGLDVKDKKPVEAAKMAVKAVVSLKKKIGLTDTLKDFKVPNDPAKLKPLVELAAADGQVSYNPHYLEEEDILKIYMKAI
ncbi:MAG TPA: iron-containing alcohol dehydrogenase [Smithellaceae bacterium]|nr:iron-containing alcohol dehydrogenase [Smithellaceae bacterium]HPE06562.1 iron-containing alcohol dehydrogenase [Smithellaceae bacterium]HRY37480.1 iron-containing alcohol dehydrogenase [Smithellaceae bacterium]